MVIIPVVFLPIAKVMKETIKTLAVTAIIAEPLAYP